MIFLLPLPSRQMMRSAISSSRPWMCTVLPLHAARNIGSRPPLPFSLHITRVPTPSSLSQKYIPLSQGEGKGFGMKTAGAFLSGGFLDRKRRTPQQFAPPRFFLFERPGKGTGTLFGGVAGRVVVVPSCPFFLLSSMYTRGSTFPAGR